MPPRGYHDEYKELSRKFIPPEVLARQKAAYGRERDLRHLVRMALLQDRDGISAWAAAGKIADEIGANPRACHAVQKRLHAKFQKAPALYRRLAAAGEDPKTAAHREILLGLGLDPVLFLEPI
jgi:hypothetical protein